MGSGSSRWPAAVILTLSTILLCPLSAPGESPVADLDALLQGTPQAGMAGRLEGRSQLEQFLLCQDGAYPLSHPS